MGDLPASLTRDPSAWNGTAGGVRTTAWGSAIPMPLTSTMGPKMQPTSPLRFFSDTTP